MRGWLMAFSLYFIFLPSPLPLPIVKVKENKRQFSTPWKKLKMLKWRACKVPIAMYIKGSSPYLPRQSTAHLPFFDIVSSQFEVSTQVVPFPHDKRERTTTRTYGLKGYLTNSSRRMTWLWKKLLYWVKRRASF